MGQPWAYFSPGRWVQFTRIMKTIDCSPSWTSSRLAATAQSLRKRSVFGSPGLQAVASSKSSSGTYSKPPGSAAWTTLTTSTVKRFDNYSCEDI